MIAYRNRSPKRQQISVATSVRENTKMRMIEHVSPRLCGRNCTVIGVFVDLLSFCYRAGRIASCNALGAFVLSRTEVSIGAFALQGVA